MKLRQKLAVVLASAMVVTAVPVVTMAASTVTLKNNAALAVAKDEQWAFNATSASTAPSLQIVFSGHVSGNEVFYVKVDGADFKEDSFKDMQDAIDDTIYALNRDLYKKIAESKKSKVITVDKVDIDSQVTFQRQGDKEVKVTVSDELAQASKDLNRPVTIPLVIKAGDKEIKVTLDPANSTIEVKDSWVVASASDKAMEYSVGDKTSFYTDKNSKIADLTIKETYKGAMKKLETGKWDDEKKKVITLELDSSDFNFYRKDAYKLVEKKEDVFDPDKATLLKEGDDYELSRGFYDYKNSIKVYAAVDKKDEGKLYLFIDNTSEGDSIGEIKFKNLRLEAIVDDPDEGDFEVDIKSDGLKSEGSKVVMGEVTSFKNVVKMKDDKAKEIKAGRIEEIEFSVEEAVENTMISDRTFSVKLLDNAHFDYKGLVKDLGKDSGITFDAEGKLGDLDGNGEKNEEDDWKKAAAKLDKKLLADKVLDNYNKDDKGDWKDMQVQFDTDDDGLAIVDTLVVTVGMPKEHKPGNADYADPAHNNDHKDKVKFKVKVCVPIDKKDKEKVELEVSGRALERDVFKTTAITIKNPLKVDFKETTLKVGLKDQASTTEITVAETDKEMFMEDGTLYIGVKDLGKATNDGLRIASATLEVDGQIRKVKSATKDNFVKFSFKRDSKAAASVKVKEVTYDVDRTVPEGTYDIEIWGSAICQESKDYPEASTSAHKITLEKAIKIGTPNTQDITSAGLAKGVAKFVIGEAKYTLNDKEVEMAGAKSYIQEPGFTMVPVRYAANAFGVADKDIIFGKGTVTIFAGERTISITNNSDVALVNGNPVTMGAKVVIKEGRTYAPAGEIARLLGIKTSWDSNTKTATFEN